MNLKQPASASEALTRHGMRHLMHPLNLEHFRRERRRQHVRTATFFLQIVGGGVLLAAGAYALLVSACIAL